MASLWKHPLSRYWTACFTDPNGRRMKRSTKTTDRQLAQKMADAFEAATRASRTSAQMRKVMASLHKDITGGDLLFPSFRDYSAKWIERKSPEVSTGTVGFYQTALSQFTTFLGEKADADISTITRENVTEFRNELAAKLNGKTVNHRLKVLRMVFLAARSDGALVDSPSEFVKTVKKKAGGATRRPFTIPELRAVVSVAGEEWRSMIMCGLYTGQRLGDIASLTWQNVDLQRGEIRLTTRKTGKVLVLPIAAPLRENLLQLPAGDDSAAPLHPNSFATVARQGRVTNLSNQFADILAQAGLRPKQAHRKTGAARGSGSSNLSFHCLRHTAVSMMKDAGIPEAVVMEMVGHDSEQMSHHYTHVGADALTRAAASLPAICIG